MARNRLRKDDLLRQEVIALELRSSGVDYRSIAAKMGIASPGHAHRIVQRGLKRVVREAAEDVVDLEVGRLDALLAGVWHRATLGDPASIASALSIMARRAKYLGLDAPEKREVTGAAGGPVKIETDHTKAFDYEGYRELFAGRGDRTLPGTPDTDGPA